MTYKPPIRIGMVGGGLNSAVGIAHKTAFELDGRFKLTCGVFSRDYVNNQNSASNYGIGDRFYKNLTELLLYEKKNLDCILICTPQDQHKEQVIECIKAGLPIICEKALVATVADAELISNELYVSGGALFVTYNYTGYPMIRELRTKIREGFFGDIHYINLQMPQEGFARVDKFGKPMFPQKWRQRDGEIPTISLDLGIHLHMLGKFLIDSRPTKVVAVKQSVGNFKVVDNVSSIVKYENDIIANILFGKVSLGHRNGLAVAVYGSKGSARWIQSDPENLYISDQYGTRSIIDRGSSLSTECNLPRYQRFKVGHPAGFIEAFANYYSDLAEIISQRNDVSSTGKDFLSRQFVFGIEESLEGLKLLHAMQQSSNYERWVDLNDY